MPASYFDGAFFPAEARAKEMADFSNYTSTMPRFWGTEPAVEFENQCLKSFAKDLAVLIRKAPPFDPAFPIIEAEDDRYLMRTRLAESQVSKASGEANVPGVVYTFYSYKGGVGRSMALVNVGVLMALAGKRVLLVDWDLEAPGLEAYFRNAAKLSGDPRAVPGVVDLLEARASGESLDWKACRLQAVFLGSSLDIISAGRRSPDYRSRVQKLDWDTLYSEHKVGNFVNQLREEWRMRST